MARLIERQPISELPIVYRTSVHKPRYTIFSEYISNDPVSYPPPDRAAHIVHAFSVHGSRIRPDNWRRPDHYRLLLSRDFVSRVMPHDPEAARDFLNDITGQDRVFCHNDVRERNFLIRADGTHVLIDYEMASDNINGADFHHSALLACENPQHVVWHRTAIAVYAELLGKPACQLHAAANLYAAARCLTVWHEKSNPQWHKRAEALFHRSRREWCASR